MNSLGIDASSYDGVINWQTTASRGVSFATIRATWNNKYKDGKYQQNLVDAQANHINVIPYHWFVPYVDPIAQANWFLAHSDDTGFYRMVDLEDTRTVFAYHGIGKEILKFLETFHSVTNQDCALYTSPAYIKAYLYDCIELVNYPLLIAHWDAAAPLVPRPFIPNNWLAWQFTAKANAPYYGIGECKQASLYVWNGAI